AEGVISLLTRRPDIDRFDSIFRHPALSQWAAISMEDLEPSRLMLLLSRTLTHKRDVWSGALSHASPDDAAAATLQAWLESLQEFAETRELSGETERWAAMQAWFSNFNDERGQFANAFRKLREIRNRVAHDIERAEDPGLLRKYALLE